jgi:16S rRNA (guanine966-N2)-methyltransferase
MAVKRGVLRVIAGEFRGARIQAPPGRGTRPITDRVKETLFNILGSRFGTPGHLPPVLVLDAFAGSGALGIESLSRGAQRCIFIERGREALPALRGNVAHLRIESRSAIVAANAWSFAPVVAAGEGFGLVFVDPPYRDAENMLRLVDLAERLGACLEPGGTLVLRTSSDVELDPRVLLRLACDDCRRIASMKLWFLVPAEQDGRLGNPLPTPPNTV